MALKTNGWTGWIVVVLTILAMTVTTTIFISDAQNTASAAARLAEDNAEKIDAVGKAINTFDRRQLILIERQKRIMDKLGIAVSETSN